MPETPDDPIARLRAKYAAPADDPVSRLRAKYGDGGIDSMSPAEFAEFTTKNRPRDAAEAKRWTERVDRELAGPPAGASAGALDYANAIGARAVSSMWAPAVGLARRMNAGLEASLPKEKREAFRAEAAKSLAPYEDPAFGGDAAKDRARDATRAMEGSFGGKLALGVASLPGVVSATRGPRGGVGGIAAYEGTAAGTVDAAAKGAAFAGLGGAFGSVGAKIAKRFGHEVADKVMARVANGSLSFAVAGQVVNGTDAEALAVDAALGGVLGIVHGRAKGKPAPVEAKPAAVVEQAPPTAVRPAIEPVSAVAAVPEVAPGAPKTPPAAPTAAGGAPLDRTSLKNRIVAEERVARGVEPLPEEAPQTREGWMAEGRRIVAENPNEPRRIIEDVTANPRTLRQVEQAVIDVHKVNLNAEVAKADAAGIAARERGNLDEAAAHAARAASARAEFDAVDVATKTAGREWGREGVARQMEVAQDYSLLAMERQRRATSDYKPLTSEQAVETKALHERIAKAEAERDTYAARLAEVEARRAMGAPRGSRAAPGTAEYGKANKLVTRERYEALKVELRDAFKGKLSAGIDPTVLAKVAEFGVFHIEAGARSFATWSKRMVEQFGEDAKPHLRALWAESRNQARERGVFDEALLRGVKTRARGRAEELEGRVATGNLEIPARRPIHRDAEAVRLEARVELAKKAWNEALFKDHLANRTAAQKAFGAAVETATTARALMTSFDFSGVLRQGGFVALAHPVRAARALPDMFRAFASKEAQARSEAEISMRPNYGIAKRAGLFLAESGPTNYRKMEEAYMSRTAEKIPVVAGSQRAYTTFLNRLRMDSFDAMLAGLSRGKTPTPAETVAIANYINIATGRGGGNKGAGFVAGMNGVLFSPRLVASRFQLLAGSPMYGGSARTRAMVAGEYARFLAGIGVVYALGRFAGGEVETDARSSDFGKIRFGEARVDPLTGLAQSVVVLRRIQSDETKDLDTGKVGPTKGAFSVATRFLRTKLAPIWGAGVNLKEGSDVTGKPATLGNQGASLVTPMSLGDIYEAMKQQGVEAGAALGLVSIFGMGLQVHDEKEPPKRRSKRIGRARD